VVVSALARATLERGTSAVISEDEVLQNDGLDAGRAHDLSDSAGVGLEVGEALTVVAGFVEDETDGSRTDGVISERIDF
jgi:hypothetical protein